MLIYWPQYDSLPRLSDERGVLLFIERTYIADISHVTLEKDETTFYVARNECGEIHAGFMAVQSSINQSPNLSHFTYRSYLPATIIMYGAFLAG